MNALPKAPLQASDTHLVVEEKLAANFIRVQPHVPEARKAVAFLFLVMVAPIMLVPAEVLPFQVATKNAFTKIL